MTQTANVIGLSITPAVGTISAARVRTKNTFQEYVYGTDLDNVFFGSSEFAEPCQYTHVLSGNTVQYNVIFDDPTQNVNANSKTEATLLYPQIQIALHQMEQRPNLKDSVLIRGVDYYIDSLEEDGVGVATLFLVRKTSNIH